MSSHHYACFADIVKEDFVKEIAPDEYEDFRWYLEEFNSDLDGWASWFGDNQGNIPDEFSGDSDKLIEKWEALKLKFTTVTGLVLYITYHNAESRGDEIDGRAWTVGGVYDYTTFGARYKGSIERKQWVICG